MQTKLLILCTFSSSPSIRIFVRLFGRRVEEWRERERERLDYARRWLVNGDGIPSVRPSVRPLSLYPLSFPSLRTPPRPPPPSPPTNSHRSFYPIPFAAIPSTKFPVRWHLCSSIILLSLVTAQSSRSCCLPLPRFCTTRGI